MLGAVLLLARAASAAPTPGDQGWGWLPGDLADYAPVGLPDFSQCRRGWSRPAAQAGRPAQWTVAAPVALADALWWLDSRAEPGRAAPPAVSDGHGLVTFYPVFGRAKDDHDPANLGSLVEDLALRLGTDGRGGGERRGTAWDGLLGGLRDYLSSRRLEESYALATRVAPDAAWLRREADQGAAMVAALGVWERQDDGWRRVGGHYAAVAGVAPDGGEAAGADGPVPGALALADPLADQVAQTGRGRMVPPDAALHSCRLAPAAHDDAAVVAHDGYALEVPPSESPLPDRRLVLAGYFGLEAMGEAAAFVGQIHRLGVGHEEHAMRVAHAHGGRIAGQRQVHKVGRAGERHPLPVEDRRAHVDADAAIVQPPGAKIAARGPQGQPVAAQPGHDQIGDAARGVAAGPGARAVGIPEIQRHVGGIMIADFGKLVEADAPVPVAQRAGQRRCGHGGAAP
jgi:hypothetical protein